MGVEVFYGRDLDFNQFMQSRRQMYDLVLVSKSQNASKILKDLKGYAKRAFIVYDAGTVRATAEIARLKLIGETVTDDEQKRMILEELEPMKYVDAMIGVSEFEKRELERLGCKNLLAWGYPSEVRDTGMGFSDRKDLLFAGRCSQSPAQNQAVIFHFTSQIFPKVREVLGCHLFIVGTGHVGSISSLNSGSVTVVGDPDVSGECYKRCRVFVLSGGCADGISFELLEAFSHGIPAVVSPFAATQLSLSEGEGILIAQDDKAIAEKIIQLYQDEGLWCTLQRNALGVIRDRYDPEMMKGTLSDFLQAGIHTSSSRTQRGCR